MKKRRQVHNHPEMTPQELARCRPAAEVDRVGLPIPTHLVSNEEYFPPFLQTSHQKQVEARVLDALDRVPKRLNISRRQFLETSAGLAASFVALNEVFRTYAYGESLFRVGKEAGFDHAAFAADGPPSDLFVFDDQCHLVRGAGSGHSVPRVFVSWPKARPPGCRTRRTRRTHGTPTTTPTSTVMRGGTGTRPWLATATTTTPSSGCRTSSSTTSSKARPPSR